jgi:hypothetical protein
MYRTWPFTAPSTIAIGITKMGRKAVLSRLSGRSGSSTENCTGYLVAGYPAAGYPACAPGRS